VIELGSQLDALFIRLLPQRLRRRVKALHAAVVPIHHAGPSIDPALLTSLAGACRDREQLAFRYADMKSKASQRQVEPHGLVHAGSRWYLVAWDLDRADWRSFRVDRITSKATAGRRFVPRPVPHGDVGAYVTRSLTTHAYPYQARVLLHTPIENVAERISPIAGRLERVDAEHCVLETGGHSLAALGLYISFLNVEFEVLDPPELRAELRVLAERLLRAATPR